MTRLLGMVFALALLLTLSGFTSVSTAHAAGLGSRPTQSAPTAHKSKITPAPSCNGSVNATPYYQSINVGQYAAQHVNWSCEGYFNVTVNLDWGDGNTTTYTCYSNCNSGGTDMGHQYNQRGEFYLVVYMTGSASGSYGSNIVDVF